MLYLAKGSPILTRACNLQPCTNVTDEVIDSEILPTEIRIIPVSLRPQKYIKCEIKEEDMDILREDIGNLKFPPKIPSRVILNNRTISIYESGSYESILATYNLKDLNELSPFKEEPKKCIRIADNIRHTVMCSMCTNNCEDSVVQKWMDDIKQFRDGCNITPDPLPDQESDRIKDDDPRLLAVKRKLVEEDIKNAIIKRNEKETKKSDSEKNKALKLAELIALKALDKEKKFEDRLEKEELMREKEEDEEMKNEYMIEEKKKSCILKALLEQNEDQAKKENDVKEKISEIENELKEKLVVSRKRAINKLKLLKLAHDRKKLKYRGQIQDIRRALTHTMITAEKMGTEEHCVLAVENSKIKEYCEFAYADDPMSLTDCKKQENFCFICCENEFGDMHQDERELCNTNCYKIAEDNGIQSNIESKSCIKKNISEEELEKFNIKINLSDRLKNFKL